MIRFGWLVGQDILLKQLHRRVTRAGKLSARNVNRVAGHFQAGEVQGDAVRARPSAHRQRDVAAPRTDVEDAQGAPAWRPAVSAARKRRTVRMPPK